MHHYKDYPRTRYHMCKDCPWFSCEVRDYIVVSGYEGENKEYKALVSCIDCKRHWVARRETDSNWQVDRIDISNENEVSQKWVDSMGF